MKALKFENSGWCEELNMSYERGIYVPKNEEELKALEKYAKTEPIDELPDDTPQSIDELPDDTPQSIDELPDDTPQSIDELPDDTPQSIDELPDDRLRELAKEKGISNWHNMKRETLIAKLNEE